MDSINPSSGAFGPQGTNPIQGPNDQEPTSIIQDVLGLWLIFQGNVEWGNDNSNDGNYSTGQLMAKYINDLVAQISAEVKNGTASLADQWLLKNLTAGNPSLATLAAKIVAAAGQNPATIDVTDIQAMISNFQGNNTPGSLIIDQITNPNDTAYWFNPNNTNLGNALQWSGDPSQIEFWMNTFMNEMVPLLDGMQNSSNSFEQQVADAKEYASIVENLYNAFNQFPDSPFTKAFDDYMNTLVPGQGSATLLGFMNVFSNPSFTPTAAQLQAFINILEPGGGDSQNNGFQAILGDLLKAMQNGGIFQNGPTT